MILRVPAQRSQFTTQPEFRKVRALFQYLDVDGNGAVTKEELTVRLLGEALASAGVGPKARKVHRAVKKGKLRAVVSRPTSASKPPSSSV